MQLDGDVSWVTVSRVVENMHTHMYLHIHTTQDEAMIAMERGDIQQIVCQALAHISQ